jgi:hypothetical protein
MQRMIKLTIGLMLQSVLLCSGCKTLENQPLNPFNPPPKANTIVIEKTDNAANFLLEYAKHLQDFGFSIEKVDKELLTLSTDFKSYKFSGVAVIKIVAFARQNGPKSILEIKGNIEVSNPFGGQVPFNACNCGSPGDAQRNGFNEILKTLDNFAYDSIEFVIK